nr:MAG TPA: hypothetical protein [Caudoviricetes sp.]
MSPRPILNTFIYPTIKFRAIFLVFCYFFSN